MAIDFQLLFNGQAIATLTPLDIGGNPTVAPTGMGPISWTASNPAAIGIAPAPNGLSAVLTGTAVAVGVTVSASAMLADGVTKISGTSKPIDVGAGVIASFGITLQ